MAQEEENDQAQVTPCTLCGNAAVIRVWLPQGCAAFRDQDQSLCAQHALSCEPVEPGRVIAVHHREVALVTGWIDGVST